ncbi:MAG: dephospho-CoA kinase [Anaerovoracaceae bacterium]
MKVIGITGGIGSGKSVVSDHLKELGYYVIDADEISREITAPGSPVLDELAERFGQDILMSGRDDSAYSSMKFENGEKLGSVKRLDRKKLADIVFHDKKKKAELESIVTDRVIAEVKRRIAHKRNEDKSGVIFLDAPTLYETGADVLTDDVWLITADRDRRAERVVERDHTDRASAEARIDSQMPDEVKARMASKVIENNGSVEDLLKKIDGLLGL